jgi:hypothetical protein
MISHQQILPLSATPHYSSSGREQGHYRERRRRHEEPHQAILPSPEIDC